MREKIKLTDTNMDVMLKTAEGNPGAISVITQLDFWSLLDLDDMNIRGSQIWVGYKDFAHEDINVFKEALLKRDEEMVNMINDECASYGEIAVTHGGSYRL